MLGNRINLQLLIFLVVVDVVGRAAGSSQTVTELVLWIWIEVIVDSIIKIKSLALLIIMRLVNRHQVLLLCSPRFRRLLKVHLLVRQMAALSLMVLESKLSYFTAVIVIANGCVEARIP